MNEPEDRIDDVLDIADLRDCSHPSWSEDAQGELYCGECGRMKSQVDPLREVDP